MAISRVKKTRWVRRADYEAIQVPTLANTIFIRQGFSGCLNALKCTSLIDKTFVLVIDGETAPQTSTLVFDYNGGTSNEQWISPDLDRFTTTPSICNISFAQSIEIRLTTPLSPSEAMELDVHFEYDVEVDV